MTWATLRKSRRESDIAPNLSDYAEVRSRFSWTQAEQELEGLPHNLGLNIAHEAVDRHANSALASQVALRWLGKNGAVENYSYGRLKEATNRFANVLKQLGVEAGDRVYTLTGRIPELYVTALGTLKHRAVFCPLFSAFGPEPIRTRLAIGQDGDVRDGVGHGGGPPCDNAIQLKSRKFSEFGELRADQRCVP